jgi:hypothetical protein
VNLYPVIPAKAGIQLTGIRPYETHVATDVALAWIPAFAGMTDKRLRVIHNNLRTSAKACPIRASFE